MCKMPKANGLKSSPLSKALARKSKANRNKQKRLQSQAFSLVVDKGNDLLANTFERGSRF